MPIDADQFRDTLSQWASGVTIVTTSHEGTLYGMTASSFSSLSLNPPLVLVCVSKGTHTHQAMCDAGFFAVNILSAAQVELGRRFAGLIPEIIDRFDSVPYAVAQTGAPVLPDVVAWLDCRTYQQHDGGDHTIILGEVLASQVNGGSPLLYFNRHWGEFNPTA